MSSEEQKSLTRLRDAEHEALSRRGLSLYEGKLKPVLEPTHNSEYVAVPVDSED